MVSTAEHKHKFLTFWLQLYSVEIRHTVYTGNQFLFPKTRFIHLTTKREKNSGIFLPNCGILWWNWRTNLAKNLFNYFDSVLILLSIHEKSLRGIVKLRKTRYC